MHEDGSEELTNLARLEDIEEAQRAAASRHRIGDGHLLSVEELRWAEGPGPDTTLCFGVVRSGLRRGELCTSYAGSGTSHPGVGYCSRHGGSTPEGIREAAWVVAHGFATALDVTPWEGLLWAVRIAAGRVAFCEQKLGTAWDDRQLEPPQDGLGQVGSIAEGGQNLNYWVKQAELWHTKLAQVSKLAIDAGVAERLVRQLELEAQLMLRATKLTLDELGLSDEDRQRALGIMSRNLLALEAEEVGERAREGAASE